MLYGGRWGKDMSEALSPVDVRQRVVLRWCLVLWRSASVITEEVCLSAGSQLAVRDGRGHAGR